MNALLAPLQPYLFWIKIASWVAAVVGIFGAGFYASDRIHVASEQAAVIVKQKQTIIVERKQAEVSHKVAAATEEKVASIENVFDDRARAIQEEPKNETNAGLDRAVPKRFICMWNSANRSELPPTGCLADEEPSVTTLRDVEGQHDREALIGLTVEEKLKGLQTWVCEQAKLRNGVAPPFEMCR